MTASILRCHMTSGVMRMLLALVASVFLSVGVQAVVHAEEQTVPYRINFQGRLTDSSGHAMSAGTYNMIFRIYDNAAGGSLLWEGERAVVDGTGVSVSEGGLFSVQLGRISTMPADLFANPELYFEIELPTPVTAKCATAGCAAYSEGPMTPRRRMLSSPYAFNADQLDGIDSTAFGQLAADNSWTGGSNMFGGSTFAVSTTTSATISSPAITLSGGGLVSATNTALFQNVSDSSQAFTIARSDGTGLFIADTTNARIYIGGQAPDSTAVLFVVDSTDAASDPVGTDGAIYYNTAKQAFRCYQGEWLNCVSSTKVVIKAADQVANASSTAMQNVEDMTVPVLSNSTYSYEVMFVVNVSNTSADMRYTLTAPSGAILSGVGTATTGTTGQAACTLTSTSGTTCSVATSTAARTIVTIRGTVTTAATAGVLQLRFAQNTATASASPTALAGSTIHYEKLQ